MKEIFALPFLMQSFEGKNRLLSLEVVILQPKKQHVRYPSLSSFSG